MEHFQSDVYWRQMPVHTLVKYCQMNKKLLAICKNPSTWQYLLKRDFNIDESKPNPLKSYFKQVLSKICDIYLELAIQTQDNAPNDAMNWYNLALSVLGRPIKISDPSSKNFGQINYYFIFGNKVSGEFYENLITLAKNYQTSLVEELFHEAHMF